MSKLFYPYMMNRSAPTVHNHRRLGLHLQREGAGQDARSRPGIKAIHIMLKYFFSSMDSAVVNQCEAFMEGGGGSSVSPFLICKMLKYIIEENVLIIIHCLLINKHKKGHLRRGGGATKN